MTQLRFGAYREPKELSVSGGCNSGCYQAVGPDGAPVFLKRTPLDTPTRRRSFHVEVAALTRLHGVEGVPTLRGYHADLDRAEGWIASTWCGDELTEASLTLQDVLDAGRVVDRIHAHGLVHTDLKPSNLVRGPHGLAVVDYGLARRPGVLIDTGEHDDVWPMPPSAGVETSVGVAMGTPAWMAPELARGCRERMSFAVDTYQVACLAYTVLNGGRRPGRDLRVSAAMHAHAYDGFAAPSSATAEQRALLSEAMDLRPSARLGLDRLLDGVQRWVDAGQVAG